MGYTALVPPRVWVPVGPYWAWIGGSALGDDQPVRLTLHSNPFSLACDGLVDGLRVLPYQPEPDIDDLQEHS